MPNILSAFIVTRYPEDSLKGFLGQLDPQDWMESIKSRLQRGLASSPHPISGIKVSPEDRLLGAVSRAETLGDREAVGLLHHWTDVLIRECGHYPILFYITLGTEPQDLSLDLIDDGVYQVGGPLILIEPGLWQQSDVIRHTFKSDGTATFVNGASSVIVRDPEKAWLQRFEQNLDRIKGLPSRHPLDYVPANEDDLPPEERENRQQLDNLVNIPEPGQRKFLKPEKTVIHLQQYENADAVSLRAYTDVPIGKRQNEKKSIGGRALLVSCNSDANRIGGWRPGDSDFEVHNAVSLHFMPSVRKGTLPEAMSNGRVVLKRAWISGNYTAEEMPDTDRRPKRMVWPQYNLPGMNRSDEKEKES